jgi:D-alanine transaminase
MHNLPPLPCYLNGEFTLLPDAKISVMDRGFIFGDGVYEVVPVYGGQPFRLAQHMTRLERSLTEMRIPNPLTPVQWSQLVSNLIACYADSTGASVESTNQLVYIQITRGVALRDHAMPKDLQPTVFAMSNRMTQPRRSNAPWEWPV